MLAVEVLSRAVRIVTPLVVVATLGGVVIAALRAVTRGIMAMTANAAQRAAGHDKRHPEAMDRLRDQHVETMAAPRLRPKALETRTAHRSLRPPRSERTRSVARRSGSGFQAVTPGR